MSTPSFDRFKDGYLEHLERGPYSVLGGESHEYYISVKVQEFMSLVRRSGVSPGVVIDVGCGIGVAERLLSSHCTFLAGCDLSYEMLRQALIGRPMNCSFIQGTGLSLPFISKGADALFSFSLFHHVPKDSHLALVQEMKRVLKPGGLLAIFEHNPFNPLTRYVVKHSEVDRDAHLLTPAWLRECMTNAGLKPICKKYIIFFPRWFAFLKSLEDRLGWFPLGGEYLISAIR